MYAENRIRWKKAVPLFLMMIPGLFYLCINNYLPMTGILVAFKDYDPLGGIFGSKWIGFENFKFLFHSSDTIYILRNTLLYNVAFIILNTLFSVGMAVLLAEITNRLAVKFYQTALLLPSLVSTVILSYMVLLFLDGKTGYINNTILSFLNRSPVSWYSEPKYWPFILVFVNVWKGIGYSMIIYLSSIVGISVDYFEAARIDGATKWQQIKCITLPLLKPTVITLFILSVGQIFRSDFGLFYQMPRNSGSLYSVTRTLDVYIYQALMKNNDYSMSSAASVYQSIVGFVLIIGANKLVKKYESGSALF